jgi:hypothetical protein
MTANDTDGWWPCPCCDGDGGSNSGPLPDHAALVAAATEMAQRTYVDEEGLTATVPYDRLYVLRKALWGSDDNIIAALDALDMEEQG